MPGIGSFQIVDPADGTTVLFDLNDTAGTAGNPGGLVSTAREVNLGRAPLQSNVVEPDTGPGGITTFSRYGLAPMGWRQRLLQPQGSIDQLSLGLGRLQQLLGRGGTLRIQYLGASQVKFADFEPSEAPVLMGEDPADMFHALELFHYPEGVPVQLMRQPFLRWPPLDPRANALLNGSLLNDANADGTPDSWAWFGAGAGAVTGKAIDSSFDACRFVIATTDIAYLGQTVPAAPGDIWTLQFEAFASDAVTADVRAMIIWKDGGGAQVGSTQQSALTLLGMSPNGQLVYVTTTAAPAGTVNADCRIRFTNVSAAGVTIWVRKAMMGLGALVPYREGPIVVSNDPALTTGAGRVIPHFQEGDAPGPVELILQPLDASVAVSEFLVGYKSSQRILGGDRLADYLNTTKLLQLESGTLGADTTSVADAQASGGNVAKVNPSDTLMQRRSRVNRTTLLDSMRGKWRMYLRAKPSAASKWGVQLKWAPSAADPATRSLQEVQRDFSAASSFEFIDIPLGTLTVPDDLAVALNQLTFEVWARRLSGTGFLSMDSLMLAATDRWGRIYVPGGTPQTWLGSELLTPTSPGGAVAGTVIGTTVSLDAVNERAGTPPNTGIAFAPGNHTAVFVLYTQPTGGSSCKIRIRDITTPGDVYYQQKTGSGLAVYAIPWTAVAGKFYQLQVEYLSDYATVVYSIKDTFLAGMAQNEEARSDPSRYAAEKLDSSGYLLSDLGLDGQVPFYAEPGEGMLWLAEHEVPLTGFDDGQSKLARTFKVYKRQSPRSLS